MATRSLNKADMCAYPFTSDREDGVVKRNHYIARIEVLERHADGSHRNFTVTRSVSAATTLAELYDWRERNVHDPVNGEFAVREVRLTPDDAYSDY